MAVKNVSRCEAMIGRIRRHQGRLGSREILARGPRYFDRTPPRGLALTGSSRAGYR